MAIARTICGTSIALVSLVDEKRQWFKACVGIDVDQTGRDIAFCDHTIRSRDNFIVEDATKDARFALNPLVTGEPRIRFYAGVPLWTTDGYCLGSLCVVDTVPSTVVEEDRLALLAPATEARLKNQPLKAVWRFRSNDGSLRHVEARSESDSNGGRVGTTYDVTDFAKRITELESELEKELQFEQRPVLKKAE